MNYFLKENKLTEEDNYSARVQVVKSHDLDGIIDLILDRRHVLSRTDLVAAFDIFFQTVKGCITRGEGINLPLFNLGYSISGVFDDDDDMFDPERHRIKVNLNDGVLITEAIQQIKPVKTDTSDTDPLIRHFIDAKTNTTNDIATSQSLFEIKGTRLKIGGNDASVGLFFVAQDGTETKVELLVNNTSKKLIGQSPELDAGTYHLRLRTQSSSSNHFTIEPKEHTSAFTLTVT
ncbi:DNA-binding domain-containing protein [Carboxylicivirga sp. RSCT41]|uniref:DNA-binding domain-containing protein n=1 Tax=Carboxylicivirga agarovorans TaxID=3417570 RepID=UPI003D330820